MATAGLGYLTGHFLPRCWVWCKYWRTWAVVRQGRVVRSRIDYILGSDRRFFRNVDVPYPRHNSDHFMVVGCLCGASLREHSCYLRHSTRLPICPPGRQTRTQADKLFAELRRAVLKLDKQAARHNSWILEEMWRLVDELVSARREPGRYQRII